MIFTLSCIFTLKTFLYFKFSWLFEHLQPKPGYHKGIRYQVEGIRVVTSDNIRLCDVNSFTLVELTIFQNSCSLPVSCVWVYVQLCAQVCVWVCECVWECVCKCVCECVCECACECVCKCACVKCLSLSRLSYPKKWTFDNNPAGKVCPINNWIWLDLSFCSDAVDASLYFEWPESFSPNVGPLDLAARDNVITLYSQTRL